MIYYPSIVDEKRESYYSCPYCGNSFSIHLRGNEDVETKKIKFLNYYSNIPYENKNFLKIIDFYLFNCPARHTQKTNDPSGEKKYNFTFSKVSARGKTFAERGVVGGGLRTLRAAMKRASYQGELFDLTLDKSEDIEQYSGRSGEICLTVKNSQMSQTDAIYYAIRNAFAHGSFSVDNGIYTLENINKGKVKGRIRLKEQTLLNWIDLCSMSTDEIKNYER